MTDRGTATVGIFLITYRNTSLVHLYLLIRPICLASCLPQTVDILTFYGQCAIHDLGARKMYCMCQMDAHSSLVGWLFGWLMF